jgi:hypothetical protein
MGGSMKIGRIIAIIAAVGAVIGIATQAEAAKRKARNVTTFTGCAAYRICGLLGPIVPSMTDIAGNFYVFNPPESVPPYIPYKVLGRKSGETNIGWCKVTQVNVVLAAPIGAPGNCPVNLR